MNGYIITAPPFRLPFRQYYILFSLIKQSRGSKFKKVLCDELTVPPELRAAHRQNDRAFMEACGLPVKGAAESSCAAHLMKLYQELTAKKKHNVYRIENRKIWEHFITKCFVFFLLFGAFSSTI